MQLKTYQRATLDSLDRFLSRARAQGPAAAFEAEVKRQEEEARLEGRKLDKRLYKPMDGLPEVPKVCLRLPTGGGKTLLAAEAIRLAGRTYLARDYPLTIWFVTSTAIKAQTLEALNDTRHPYRRRLDEVFGGRVRVFDVEAFETLTRADLERSACVVVATIQSFNVTKTSGRKVYSHHEDLEPHFSGLPTEGMEVVSAEEATSNDMLREGQVKFSFANLLYHNRPLMIVDEAHNAVTGLSSVMQQRLRPSAVVEFTATPRGMQNILHSVTATALKDEEMIKLPIRVRPHDNWREAVHATCATRNMLEEKAKADKDHIRPVALYQAQAKNGHPTVEELKTYLVDNALARPEWIKIATGEQRELDGVNLRDPAEQTRHIITVQALKEGWDCPSAYVLCATQRLTATTAVEQLLGRVLRMPYAKRRKDAALNMAYAHVSEPSFAEAAASLRDKLIDMGFTDEEVRASLKPRGIEQNDQGDLFDPDDVAPKPVLQFSVPDTPEARERLNALQEQGVDYIPQDDGTLKAGVRGDLSEEVAQAAEELVSEAEKSSLRAAVETHRAKVEAARTPADKGAMIEVPMLLVKMEDEVFSAETDQIMERIDWSLHKHAARLTEEELSFNRQENVVEIDLRGDKLIYTQTAQQQPILSGLHAPADVDLEATLVQWMERECRASDIPPDELRAWIAAVVADLLTRRDIHIRTLIEWQHTIAARLRWKLDEIRIAERTTARQIALFGDEAAPTFDPRRVIRFDASVYATVPTTPTGAVRLDKHLLGPDRVPLLDSNVGGEEFTCAVELNGLEEVDVWVRNVARHRDSFWLPRLKDRFYPDFVARLQNGRVFIVEYKGQHLVTAEEAREKDILGRLWAKTTGNLFLMVQKISHGKTMGEQMRAAIGRE
tara:strand:+ start:2029 stop:4710 length:2682 start_codon:yes stop_codon:yes gene_type:complete